MKTKKVALGAAAAGVVAGVVGLGVLAMPAGANEQPPALPEVSAESLAESVVNAKIPALDGKVEAVENLGLPMKLLPTGASGAQVFTDGQGRAKVSLPGRRSETTVVHDGTTTWVWDSADRTVRKHTKDAAKQPTDKQRSVDPTALAKDVLAEARKYSDVKVDGTARVANRAAYELVLTPKPTERTLLREVRAAVDSETRLPLRLEVLANGQAEPALKVGFTEFNVRAQDANLFRFTPPAGATVTESDKAAHRKYLGGVERLVGQLAPQIVGEGWDTTAVVKLPTQVTGMLGGGHPNVPGVPGARGGERQGDVLGMLRQFGREITGPFGKGWVFNTKVATALLTEDGRAAIGAVPEQVLIEALGQVK